MQRSSISLAVVAGFALWSTNAMAREPDEVDDLLLSTVRMHSGDAVVDHMVEAAENAPPAANSSNRVGRAWSRARHRESERSGPRFKFTGPLSGVDSVENFSGSFHADGVDSKGNPKSDWPYTMLGGAPTKGRLTVLNAPVVPVRVELLDSNGAVRQVNGEPLVSSGAPHVTDEIKSPVFSFASYATSWLPTQFADAVFRAQFWRAGGDGDDLVSPFWHVFLSPQVKAERTIKIPFGQYAYGLKADGTCCRVILVEETAFSDALFPGEIVDDSTPIGAAELAGDITTRDVSTFLFTDTFLFTKTTSNCCILGFHSFDSEPGDSTNGNRERRYVVNYSSWVTPGLFATDDFADAAPLSHEISEIYSDPFVNNATPWWLAPNGNCQNNLESGDGIEGLPNASVLIKTNGVQYHAQNEALLQWFTFGPSNAFKNAYSFPDIRELTALSAPQGVGCK